MDSNPTDLWKNVCKTLSAKKSEDAAREALLNMDLSAIKNDVFEITKLRLNNNYNIHNEMETSYINKCCFDLIEPNYKISTKNAISSKNTISVKNALTPSWFPKSPLQKLNDPSFFKKLDLDTLFFIFYFFQGTIQQTYAAARLKSEAWRFHLKYKMWFQRLDEPKIITVDYEKGEFLFFDYETTWNFMKKNDFVFEYCYLEHNEHF